MVLPETTTVKPESVTPEPEYFSVTPESKPEYFSVKPESTAKPEFFSAIAEYFSVTPEYFSIRPEYEPKNTSLPETILPKPEGEPTPEWAEARIELGAAWYIHIYGFSILFLLVAIYGLRPTYQEIVGRRRPLTLAFNIMIMIFGLTRFITLIGDPYGSTGRLDPLLLDILWSAGEPLITGAFLLFLSLLQDITKGNLTRAKYMKAHVLIRGIVLNFALELSADFCLNYTISGIYLSIACHVYYFCTGMFIFITFSIVTRRLKKNKTIFAPGLRLKLIAAVALSATLGLLLAIIFIYSAYDLGVRKDVMFIEAWVWWSHQFVMRLIEVAMAIMAHVLHSLLKQHTPTLNRLAAILPL